MPLAPYDDNVISRDYYCCIRGEECGEDTPLPTSIMMTTIDSPPRIAERERRADSAAGGT